MTRLIDAEQAEKVLSEYYHHRTDTQHQALREALSKVPTVDAVKVVRCKDCKHWDGVDTCDVIDAPVWDNDFCSMAERKEE